MTRPLGGALFFVALASAVVVACGDSKPEAKAPEPPNGTSDTAPDMPAPTASTIASATPPAATSSAPPAETASAAAPPETPKPSANGIPSTEPKDECTPVGVDFEKRARPKLKECYADGKKKDANLQGTVKIKITVDLKGKIKSTKVLEKTLPDPVADCMLKVVKSTPFPEVEKCWDSTITIPITFPTPR